MRNQPRSRGSAPDPETNVTPDLFRDDLRQNSGEVPAGGGFTPKSDGGNEQRPIHDEDQEDATPSDYEREIDRLDAAVRAQDR